MRFLCLVSAVLIWCQCANGVQELASDDVKSSFQSTHCEGAVRPIRMNHKTFFTVPAKIFDEKTGPSENLLLQYAEIHSRYFVSYWVNQIENGKSGGYRNWILPLVDRATVKVLGKSKSTYGRNLKLAPFLEKPTDLLFGNALQMTDLEPQDQVLRVEYQMEIDAIACGTFPENKVKVVVPLDPLLIYSQAFPKSGWAEHPKTGKKIYPCAARTQFYTPIPEKLWYSWDPDAEYADVKGKLIRCRDFVHLDQEIREESVAYQVTQSGSILSPPEIRQTLLRQHAKARAPLHASILIGTLVSHPSQELIRKMNTLFEKGTTLSAKVSDTKLGLRKMRDLVDVSSVVLFDTLNDVAELIKVDALVFEPRSSHFELKIQGRLKVNQQKLVLRIYWGNTGFEQGASSPHWSALLSAYRSDDILIYSGHSGMGENLSRAQAERFLAGKDNLELAPRKSLAIAVNSCRTLSALWNQERDLRGAEHRWILAPMRSSYYRRFPTLALLFFLQEQGENNFGILRRLSKKYAGDESLIFASLARDQRSP